MPLSNFAPINNRILVTVTKKNTSFLTPPIWNRVMLTLQGDMTNMLHLQQELQEVKNMVNSDMNKKGLALKDVDVKIEFKH